ncbi:stress-induced protein YchH [Budvicia diplopodorum]|uniref:stress-induced protein YchH n=1 Tax=Budvicia diplopodorum TaxID=1119056 RepID=UPI0013598F48|nr:stress-induced protein YchH [Budvicia diplopodorum]
MKRKTAVVLGNVLMGVGLVLMIGSIAFTVLGLLKDFFLPGAQAHLPIVGIFIGALVWLIGARLGGREKIEDRYWWIKHGGRNDGFKH